MPIQVVTIKGRPNLYLRGTVLGQEVYESTGTADPEIAEAIRIRREAGILKGRVFGQQAVVTFDEAVQSYLKKEPRGAKEREYIDRLMGHWCPGWDARPARPTAEWPRLADLDQVAVDRAIEALVPPRTLTGGRIRQPAPATKARLQDVIVAILNHAARRGWCDRPNLERPGRPRQRTRWLAPAEARRLIAAAREPHRTLVTFLLCTGARLGEAIDLPWDDVDLTHDRVVLRDTKNGTDRIVALPTAAKLALANLKGRSGAVFRRPDGRPYADKERISGGQIKTAWRGIRTRAGLGPDVTPHTCRHSWATWFYGLTRDLLLLQDEGGWLTVAMVTRYTKLMPPALTVEIASVWGEAHPRIGLLPQPCKPRAARKRRTAKT